ncbi:hypothetical protein OHA77_05240 [Streptosporangium sp. NBC_01639]|uniref:hypothetical protein n=1 Tax=Streptosporangium sp. NBC_01639 TaxID=2975948 RepID=UPI00386B4752|nr:hypothetical protein OHA77_05240 [Streptosporangium sp. NBC_01639]
MATPSERSISVARHAYGGRPVVPCRPGPAPRPHARTPGGWGLLALEKTKPQSNKRFTDSGETHDDRGLKHRYTKETREVPVPPEPVAILREHIDKHGSARTAGCSGPARVA